MLTGTLLLGMTVQTYPLLFTPVYKDYIWGGDRIPRIFDREPQQGICAESWEISDRPEGMSVVCNGPLSGTSLHELVETRREKLIGTSSSMPIFPLLIKIIDAKQRLSVQVHPDDRTAAVYGGEAKTEMWYMLDAEPKAQIFAGLVPGTDLKSFREALDRERLDEMLYSITARPGEAIYVPGGRVHAIGEGCLLLEVQQNSNTTYRVYDWGRLGKDGKPRELHIAQAFQSINWKDSTPAAIEPRMLKATDANSCWEVINCPYFRITRLELSAPETITNDSRSFHILFTVAGKVDIEGNRYVERTAPGTSCLMPAALDSYRLTPVNGDTTILCISLV